MGERSANPTICNLLFFLKLGCFSRQISHVNASSECSQGTTMQEDHPPYKGSSEGQSLDTCNYSSSNIARSSISSAQLTQNENVGLSENI